MARPTFTPENHSNKGPNRRTVLTGTVAALAASALTPGLMGSAHAATGLSASGPVAGKNSALCVAHHKELSAHLRTILNSAYVDERMKNKVLSTSKCPHCQVAIRPADMDKAAFTALA
ncbi:hypothetical protein [Ahrensia sp. R2A130]|uniref:hypothetical protein n=1 Tax=Ahrensia sp. R2A130 TaxID=744979 RepID=UPI0001E0F0E1|nr:hypothetical protein [Ahrensia sp. R2A130]EFL89003.1 putative glutaredoxin [Ahrensia sp. R2A130]